MRAAVVIPITAAVSYLIGGESQTTMFAIFGSVALLIVVDFPGNRGTPAHWPTPAWAVSGLLLLISLGTLVASRPWLAVLLDVRHRRGRPASPAFSAGRSPRPSARP